QQMFSTEGMVASFFVKMLNSNLKNSYADTSILKLFSSADITPEELKTTIDPIENHYIKIFYVIHQHVDHSLTEKSQLIDFVAGYRKEFPAEARVVDSIFRDWSGHDYPVDAGPELWITHPDHEHGILVMDQFGGISVPYYTFNLNAATEADLLTFDEFSEKSAFTIIDHIRNHGPLKNYEEIANIEGISENEANVLIGNKFDPSFFEHLDGYKLNLTIGSLFEKAIIHISTLIAAWFIVVLVLSVTLYRIAFRQKFTLRAGICLFLKCLLFFIIALACLILTAET
ncbi:MAG: helix-hairpin-helix domain-containing protein, partial [Bacteroidales bacterium]|nr:helix-hairpin-helix domain-containing protein [Bacteroidales bacterium]